MHPDAEPHAALLRHRGRRRREGFLNRKGSGHRTGCRVERGEHRIARRVDDPALMGLDMLPEYRARRIQRRQGRALVAGHQP
jgi:hypothetical protein